jgi:hypothetical protein
MAAYDAASAAVGLFRNCLRRDLGLRLTETFTDGVNSNVHTYTAVYPDASKIDESIVKPLWQKFVDCFYNDVDEEDAHVMLCAVDGLPILMMSCKATDEHHLALLVGKDDQAPHRWIWQFYENYKKYSNKE